MTRDWEGCARLAAAGLWDLSDCCDSCHADDPEYLLEFVLPSGEGFLVCCAVHAAQIPKEKLIAAFEENTSDSLPQRPD